MRVLNRHEGKGSLLVRLIQELIVPAHVCALVQVEDEGVILVIIPVGLAVPDQAAEAGDVGARGDGVPAPHAPAAAARLEHLQAPGCRLHQKIQITSEADDEQGEEPDQAAERGDVSARNRASASGAHPWQRDLNTRPPGC